MSCPHETFTIRTLARSHFESSRQSLISYARCRDRREAPRGIILTFNQSLNHSWSRHIMPAMTKEQLEHFEHFGFVTAEGVLDPEEIIDPVIDEYAGSTRQPRG